MNLNARRYPLLYVITAAARLVVRRPYLALSVAAHAALLALLYYFGSYQMTLREQEAEVASSLRATSQASSAKRLQDLQTIKQLLEKSAGRTEAEPAPRADTPPQTPAEMLDEARELSTAIEALDKQIQAEELAKLTGVEPPPAEPQQPQAEAGKKERESAAAQSPATVETAAGEIAALEAKARATLARRQQQLESQANGVLVESGNAGKGSPGAGGQNPGNAARADIAAFIGEGNAGGPVTQSRNYAGGHGDLFDRSPGEIPAVDSASIIRGQGRMLGAGGEYANRIYLNSWYIIGPFAGRNGAGMFDNPVYPPEKAVLLDAVYYGKNKRLLKWRYFTSSTYPLVPPDAVEDAVYYGYTEVVVEQAGDLTAWIGADDDVQVYLNDRLVWKGGNHAKQTYFNQIFNNSSPHLADYNRTEGKRVLHFNKGRNKLFFKLSNGPNSAFLSMVLTRPDG
jgi:hypothetical protein